MDRFYSIRKTLVEYGSVFILTTIIVVIYFQLFKIDLAVLWPYNSDGLLNGMLAKGISQNGWFAFLPRLGTPSGTSLRAFPLFDSLNAIVMFLISLFRKDPGFILNVFYFLSFPLTALSAFWVFRKLELELFSSLISAFIYTFVPYHFSRGVMGHIFLAAYFIVPLTCYVLINLADKVRGKNFLIFSCVIGFLTGISGIYYSFFALFFLSTILLMAVARKDKAGFLSVLLVSIITCAGVFANFLQYLGAPKAATGASAIVRGWGEAELYGLKLTHLILPFHDHRLEPFARITKHYLANTMLNFEGVAAATGLAGVIGLCILASAFFLRFMHNLDCSQAAEDNSRYYRILNISAFFVLAGILLSTVASLSSILCFLFPAIRAYNRISIFLSFFFTLAFAMGLHFLIQRAKSTAFRTKIGIYVLLISLSLFLVYEEFPANNSFNRSNVDEFYKDRACFTKIEAGLKTGARIFQLPVAAFPESGPIEKMGDYEHVKAFLHTNSLRFSYGALKGSGAAMWQNHLAKLNVDQMVEELKVNGFAAVLIDKRGFKDHAFELQKGFINKLKNDEFFECENWVLYKLNDNH